MKEKLKFLTPNKTRIIVTLIPTVLTLYSFFFAGYIGWQDVLSYLPYFFIMPLGLLGMILQILVYYLIAAGLDLLIKNYPKLIVLFILGFGVFIVFFFGYDQPIVNNTINKPNYACNVDADCEFKYTNKDWCGVQECLNKDWEFYDSFAKKAFALSCVPLRQICTCEQYTCVTTDIPFDETDPEYCNQFENDKKAKCLEKISNPYL